MKVNVKLFAAARQMAGSESICLELPDRSTVGSLREALGEQLPDLRALLRHAMFAVNAEYVSSEAQIPPDAEVACIPPVSGG
jgi:molybdopterin converting factor subunit 1